MYISELKIENFKGFKSNKPIYFHEGTNVIIGHNNAGKTSVIRALELLFDNGKNKRLTIDDFNKQLSIDELKKEPPAIVISAKISESEDDEAYSDDLVTVSTWLTKIAKPYEASITYKFFLPEKEFEEYKNSMNSIVSTDVYDYWYDIEYNFLRKYTYKIYAGNPEHENIVDPDTINKFDFQFLSAIRDVERDLFTGKNSLLKEVIDFFIDYDIKNNTKISDDDKSTQIKKRKKDFSEEAKTLIDKLQTRMSSGKQHMLKYAEETGASFDDLKPSFDGRILDTELYSALKLIVENETGIKLPANQNGLGYNNLIYISLLLAKMQKNASGEYLGSNAKTFSILAIEEPEAHLHPSMQYKFLKFLNENKEKEVRQIFITSHSPNVTAAVDLDDIIVLFKENGELKSAYPGKTFSDRTEDLVSKDYVKRFLDVTKADMFFAKSLIFVEGITEQLLIPEFAKKLQKDLNDSHISIINVGGRYFEHFLKMFDSSKSNYAVNKRIVCITDIDPIKKSKNANGKWKSCFPFELENEHEGFDYCNCSNSTVDLYPNTNSTNNIRVYSQKKSEGCTFEYDLILANPNTKELITTSVSNADEINELMEAFAADKDIESMLNILRKSDFTESVSEEIKKCHWEEKERKKHLIAARYLSSIKKGVVAQELAYTISENNKKECKDETRFNIKIPSYIKEAIEWICQEQ